MAPPHLDVLRRMLVYSNLVPLAQVLWTAAHCVVCQLAIPYFSSVLHHPDAWTYIPTQFSLTTRLQLPPIILYRISHYIIKSLREGSILIDGDNHLYVYLFSLQAIMSLLIIHIFIKLIRLYSRSNMLGCGGWRLNLLRSSFVRDPHIFSRKLQPRANSELLQNQIVQQFVCQFVQLHGLIAKLAPNFNLLLSMFQILRRFDFSRYIAYIVYLTI